MTPRAFLRPSYRRDLRARMDRLPDVGLPPLPEFQPLGPMILPAPMGTGLVHASGEDPLAPHTWPVIWRRHARDRR